MYGDIRACYVGWKAGRVSDAGYARALSRKYGKDGAERIIERKTGRSCSLKG